MFYDYNCIRDVLFYVENMTTESNVVKSHYNEISNKYYTTLNELNRDLPYDKTLIWNITWLLSEEKYIKAKIEEPSKWESSPYGEIECLTIKGKDFLNNIRNQEIWDATVSVAKTLQISSFTILNKIALEIIIRVIKKSNIIDNVIKKLNIDIND